MHRNMLHLQRAVKIKHRTGEIDAQVAELHSEGYAVDADRLLDERLELAAMRDRLDDELIA